MQTRAPSHLTGLLGGLCLVLRWLVDLGSWEDPVRWVGLGLLALALAALGAGLVSSSAWGLRVFVAVAFPLLVWSLLSAVRGTGDATGLEGALGLVALVASGAAVVAARRGEEAAVEHGSRRGSHASR